MRHPQPAVAPRLLVDNCCSPATRELIDHIHTRPHRVAQALRETKLRTAKPSAKSSEQAAMVALIYRGPFAEIKDDEGYVWRRGMQVSVSACRWQELQQQGLADNFTAIPGTLVTGSCGV